MKKHFLRLIGALGVALMAASCATAYDAQGRQVQVVTPEGAAATAVVAGLIGYGISRNRHKDRYPNHYGHGYSGSYGGYGQYGGPRGYCR